MNVTKRNGTIEQVSFDKVTNRLKKLCEMTPKLNKVNFIDGKEEGEYLQYYETGQLEVKGNYKDGMAVGEWLEYWDNGKLWIKVNYKDGKKEGKQLVYDKGGKLKTTQIWKNNKLLEETKQ